MRQLLSALTPVTLGLTLLATLAAARPAHAQYMGNNFHGDFGVNSATQAAPGFYLALPLAQWNANELKDADGNNPPGGQFQGLDVRAFFPTVMAITPKKLLGANYGFIFAIPFSTTFPERASLQPADVDWGLNDLYVVPLHLGWHRKRANFVAGYGFMAPTGRYEAGGTDNVGLGMWSQEIQGGTTVYLDAARTITAATTAFLEMHSKKKDQDLKVGALLTLEGGVAYNVPKVGGAFGVAYYLQQKVSDDSGSDIPGLALRLLNLRGKNRLFGIGPNLSMAVFQHGGTIALLNFRFLWESAGKSSFQGNTFVVGLTLARPKTN